MTTHHDPPVLIHWSPLWTEGEDRPHCGADRDEVCIATRAHVTCPACRGEADGHHSRMEEADRARPDAAPVHDSHAIGQDGPPPVLALLLAAVRAALVVLRSPITSSASASAAITAYAQAAGIGTDDATEHILAAVEKAKLNPDFTGSNHDVRVIAFWAQNPQPGERFGSPDGGRVWMVRRLGRHSKRLQLFAGDRPWSPRQATRRGPLVRIGGAA